MSASDRPTQHRRWATLFLALTAAILGLIVVNNTDGWDAIGILLVVAAVLTAFVTTPPRVR